MSEAIRVFVDKANICGAAIENYPFGDGIGRQDSSKVVLVGCLERLPSILEPRWEHFTGCHAFTLAPSLIAKR